MDFFNKYEPEEEEEESVDNKIFYNPDKDDLDDIDCFNKGCDGRIDLDDGVCDECGEEYDINITEEEECLPSIVNENASPVSFDDQLLFHKFLESPAGNGIAFKEKDFFNRMKIYAKYYKH